MQDYQPRVMLWLGDSVHTPAGRGAAEAYLARSAVPVTVVAGNPDRAWQRTTPDDRLWAVAPRRIIPFTAAQLGVLSA